MDRELLNNLFESYLDVYDGGESYELDEGRIDRIKDKMISKYGEPEGRDTLRQHVARKKYFTASDRHNYYGGPNPNMAKPGKLTTGQMMYKAHQSAAAMTGKYDPRKTRPTDSYVQRNQRKTNIKDSYDYDLYDLVLEYLLDEGLCESVENAEIMMAHMSEEWVDAIVEKADNTIRLVYGKGGKGIPFGSSGDVLRKPNVGFLAQGKSFRAKNRDARSRAWDSYEKRERNQGDREREREFSNASQINRMNAAPGESKYGESERENDSFKSRYPFVDNPMHYKEVDTDYRARRRRASGR